MPPLSDLSGKTINNIEFVSLSRMNNHNKAIWWCVCPYCGTLFESLSASVKAGRTHSCGCYKKQYLSETTSTDLTGMIFGKLVVLSYAGSPSCGTDNRPRRVYRCRCSCGAEKIVRGEDLSSRKTTSCGCFNIEQHTTHGLSKTKEYGAYLTRKRRERSAALDIEWLPSMEKALCVYFTSCVVCHSIDRLGTDHVYPLNKGYGLAIGNAVRLCKSCNSSKSDKLPTDLPPEMRDKILAAAEEFKIAWEEGYRG